MNQTSCPSRVPTLLRWVLVSVFSLSSAGVASLLAAVMDGPGHRDPAVLVTAGALGTGSLACAALLIVAHLRRS